MRGLTVGLRFLAALPRRTVSRTMGVVVGLPVPRLLLRPVLRSYVRHFGVDMSESERPLEAYGSFDDFFTRALKPGLRPIDADPRAIVSPVDGRVYASGAVDAGTILQAKGVPYSLADFLGSAEDAKPLDGGSFATFYLAPKDYHRIHWPFDARIERVRHLPGDLWPVNDAAVAGVPRLFARNERVAIIGTTTNGAPFALAPVGALNVGSIRLAFDLPGGKRLRTNRTGRHDPTTYAFEPATSVRRGDELGRFAFGSAVVLIVSDRAGRLDALLAGSTVHMGRRVGSQAP